MRAAAASERGRPWSFGMRIVGRQLRVDLAAPLGEQRANILVEPVELGELLEQAADALVEFLLALGEFGRALREGGVAVMVEALDGGGELVAHRVQGVAHALDAAAWMLERRQPGLERVELALEPHESRQHYLYLAA